MGDGWLLSTGMDIHVYDGCARALGLYGCMVVWA